MSGNTTALIAAAVLGAGIVAVVAACASRTTPSAPIAPAASTSTEQVQTTHDVTNDPSYWSPERMASARPAPMPTVAGPDGTTGATPRSPTPAAEPSVK